MKNVMCMPGAQFPSVLDPHSQWISMYSTLIAGGNVGYAAPNLKTYVEKAGLRPDVNTWDFVTFALAVSAADRTVLREQSPNGWTREINLTVAVHNCGLWNEMRSDLVSMLRFLTGDYWELSFVTDHSKVPCAKREKQYSEDCVTLLSGGVDSLVGAIDLVACGRNPILVSHTVRGNKPAQELFATRISPHGTHFSWNQVIESASGHGERSTRARSIVYFAFAALAATGIRAQAGGRREIVIAENGFISLNLSLNPGRVSSLSTKTTHPVYMDKLQIIWDRLGLNLKLTMPYKFKTKGEMLCDCRNQDLLKELLGSSTSCGRFAVYKLRHCGRCVPCMVRRAAYIKAGFEDDSDYVYEDLSRAGKDPKDVGAMAVRCLQSGRQDFDAKIAGNFAFARIDERKNFIDMYKRGLKEVQNLLQIYHVI